MNRTISYLLQLEQYPKQTFPKVSLYINLQINAFISLLFN